jgi:hypothetical protein
MYNKQIFHQIRETHSSRVLYCNIAVNKKMFWINKCFYISCCLNKMFSGPLINFQALGLNIFINARLQNTFFQFIFVTLESDSCQIRKHSHDPSWAPTHNPGVEGQTS